MNYELVSITSLMLAMVCVWMPPAYLWMLPFGAFVLSGLASGWLTPVAVLSGIGLAVVVRFHVRADTPRAKRTALTLLIVTALIFGVHLAPGFEAVVLFPDTRLSESSGWDGLYFSADKPLVGLFLLLAYRERLCRGLGDWKRALSVTAIPVLAGIAVVYVVALAIGYVGLDLSLSPLVLVWLVRNLLFTVVAEEMLFRQVIQERLERALGGRYAGLQALAVASVLFGLGSV